ncbi:MAG TPA: aminotransferase class I/II-fold pyridoxal phosphate-dependent enzyme [Rectinemataceae bacterium]|nr:aminotransferase class I/II-fold pyridoxal phosphate-dependent enzyme [Rectinemataceae bacterium]
MSLSLTDLGSAVRKTEYAVRGPLVARAQELERSGKRIIWCNIGNPQALEQKPLTWLRQVISLCEWPELATRAPGAFPPEAIEASKKILAGSHGLGAYSDSKGLKVVREAVANFIRERDGIEADPEAIYLTDGASKGVQAALRILIAGPSAPGGAADGIMIPIPQYPLYSATITLYEGRQVPYQLDEKRDWKLSRELLEGSLAKAKAEGTRVKAICVINPGNPTGSVLDRANIEMILDFAKTHRLSILADEVYQQNVYREGESFVSFAKVLADRGERDVSLFSFHSCSKGYLGECGHRGGYMEVRNVPADVITEITKLQSVSLCSNLPGQVATWCLVSPPPAGSQSHAVWKAEREAILAELAARAKLLAEGLNKIPGIECNEVAGAMYAFPKISLPAGKTDEDWCMALLEKTGICVVPGTGFGQEAGTAHFRTTILPPTEQLKEVVRLIADFHANYR